jgi:hypothetical protein
MDESDFYYVIEKRENKFVHIHRVSVGVRRIGLNAYVRSLLAFGEFERDRKLNKMAQPGPLPHLPRSFLVLSSGQYQHYVGAYEEIADCAATNLIERGTAFIDHGFPRDFYTAIGYDPKRKRYTAPTSATA